MPTPALAALVGRAERAAFHGRPGDGIDELGEAVASGDRGPETAMLRWLLAVCLGATGRYREAWAAVDPVLALSPTTAPERLTAALAASLSASLHRQLGEHDRAAGLDEQGLAWAGSLGPAALDATLDCAVGHAADAVGSGDLDAARTRLATVEQLVAQAGAGARWRARVRLGWVRAEVALLAGEPGAAVSAAGGALELAQGAAAPRHAAKSQLFLGVAQATAGEREAVGTLRAAATAATALGCLPLVWPAQAVLGAVLTPGEEADTCLDLARLVVTSLADDLDPATRDRWLARPDIVALQRV